MAFTGLPDEPGLQMLFLYHEKSIQVSWHILEKVFKFQGTKKNRFKFHAYREKTFKFWCNFVTVDDSNFLQGEMIENIENKGIGEIYKMQYIFSINIMYLSFYLFWLCRGKYSDSNCRRRGRSLRVRWLSGIWKRIRGMSRLLKSESLNLSFSCWRLKFFAPYFDDEKWEEPSSSISKTGVYRYCRSALWQ